MRKNDEIGYGSFVEKELRRVVAIKLSVNQGGFRDGSMFFRGQRDAPTPTHSTLSPDYREISAYVIILSFRRGKRLRETSR